MKRMRIRSKTVLKANARQCIEMARKITYRGTITFNVSPHVHSDILLPPPVGHLGVYASQEPFSSLWESDKEVVSKPTVIGDKIIFLKYDEVIVSGIVVGIESPGQCFRPDMQAFLGWHKLHWVPYGMEEIKGFLQRFKVNECCGHVEQQRTADLGRTVRTYVCKKCHRQWTTVETFTGVLRDAKVVASSGRSKRVPLPEEKVQ